jgi:hypothetical protein
MLRNIVTLDSLVQSKFVKVHLANDVHHPPGLFGLRVRPLSDKEASDILVFVSPQRVEELDLINRLTQLQ